MTGAELEAAIAVCGFHCIECGSSTVRLDHAPATGYVPVIVHYQLPGGQWCACTHGGAAAAKCSWDLLDALAAALAPVAEYGETVWHRRERVPS